MARDESAELREARKRIELLEQEAEVMRRAVGYLGRDVNPRGSQFRSRKFVHALSHNGLRGSMGRVGACGDNAAMELSFALLQRNVLDRQRWSTRAELRLAIVT